MPNSSRRSGAFPTPPGRPRRSWSLEAADSSAVPCAAVDRGWTRGQIAAPPLQSAPRRTRRQPVPGSFVAAVQAAAAARPRQGAFDHLTVGPRRRSLPSRGGRCAARPACDAASGAGDRRRSLWLRGVWRAAARRAAAAEAAGGDVPGTHARAVRSPARPAGRVLGEAPDLFTRRTHNPTWGFNISGVPSRLRASRQRRCRLPTGWRPTGRWRPCGTRGSRGRSRAVLLRSGSESARRRACRCGVDGSRRWTSHRRGRVRPRTIGASPGGPASTWKPSKEHRAPDRWRQRAEGYRASAWRPGATGHRRRRRIAAGRAERGPAAQSDHLSAAGSTRVPHAKAYTPSAIEAPGRLSCSARVVDPPVVVQRQDQGRQWRQPMRVRPSVLVMTVFACCMLSTVTNSAPPRTARRLCRAFSLSAAASSSRWPESRNVDVAYLASHDSRTAAPATPLSVSRSTAGTGKYGSRELVHNDPAEGAVYLGDDHA